MSAEPPNQPEDHAPEAIDAAPSAASEAAPAEGVAPQMDASKAASESPTAESVSAPDAEPAKLDETVTKASSTSASNPSPPADNIVLDLPDLGAGSTSSADKGIDLLNDVALNLKIELGRASMCIEDVLKLGEGSIVELDKLAGDPVDVFVNDRLVARGEVLVLNDNFCVRVSEIVSNEEEVPA